jgi:tetratricopeptide (TPR) repeat protein
MSYADRKQPAEALPYLQRSLELSQPHDSIVRKLYYLIVQAHRKLGQRAEAMSACQAGRVYYPHDAELLYQDGQLRMEAGEAAGAEACFQELLRTREGEHFAGVPSGLHSYWPRHQLAMLCCEQGRAAEAEAQWRAALAEHPRFAPAWMGLEDLYMAQGRCADLESVARQWEAVPQGRVEAITVRAREHLARQEFTQARQLLEESIALAPDYLRPRVLLSHVLLQEDRDLQAAEKALRDVLALDPEHAEAKQNLHVLLQQLDRNKCV